MIFARLQLVPSMGKSPWILAYSFVCGEKMGNSRRDEIIVHGDRRGDREESMGSQCGDHFVNLEGRGDCKVA